MTLAGIIAILALSGAVIVLKARHADPSLRVRFTLPAPAAAEELSEVAVSPNGKHIAFVSQSPGSPRSLWVRDLDGAGPRLLPGTADAQLPFWSPDSTAIAFFADDMLKVIRLESGSPETVADAMAGRGGSWSKSGTILFAPDFQTGLLSVSPEGALSRVTALEPGRGDSTHRWPCFLDDGKHYLYVIGSSDSKRAGTYLGELGSSAATRISGNTNRPLIAGDDVIFVREGKAIAQRLNLSESRLEGPSRVIAEPVSLNARITGATPISISANGVLSWLFAPPPKTKFVWLDRAGHLLESVRAPEGEYKAPTLSPDERTISATRIDPATGKDSVWLIDSHSGAAQRVIVDTGNSDGGLFSFDGKRLYFGDDARGRSGIYVKDLQRPGSQPSFTGVAPSGQGGLLALTEDDSFIISIRDERSSRLETWRAGSSPRPLITSMSDMREMTISRDAQWIAFRSHGPTGSDALFVQAVANAARRYQLLDRVGNAPRFSPSGDELFFISSDGFLNRVAFTPPSFSPPTPLFRLNVEAGNVGSGTPDYVPTRDGKRFLVNARVDPGQRSVATVMVNWSAPK